MGREVRRIKPGWEHPTDARGRYIPLHDGCFRNREREWLTEAAQWSLGLAFDYPSRTFKDKDPAVHGGSYADWAGDCPRPEEYMPEWPPGEATLLVMYEDTSEGTPISPPFATAEELAHWLADNEASAFGEMTATFDQWLATINRGSAVSAIFSPATGLVSGVEGMA